MTMIIKVLFFHISVSIAASQLTNMLQGSGTSLNRSVSSVGERTSNSYSAVPVPKRAETFAGFDSNSEMSKGKWSIP